MLQGSLSELVITDRKEADMGRKRKKRRRGCLTVILTVLLVTAALCVGVIAVGIWGLNDESVRQKIAVFFPESLKKQTAAEEIPYQTVEFDESIFLKKYYYGQLSKKEQTIYEEILQGVRDYAGEIYVHSETAEEVNVLFQYVLKDFPEVFWCDGASKTTVYSGPQSYTVLEPVYSYGEEERAKRQEEIEKAADECLEGISEEASDYEKILYVYDYIVNTVDYNLDAADNQNIYSVFVGRQSVCAGYSKAAQYLLERLGIFCTYVTGTAGEGQPHAWNLVRCDGDYYHVDVTWGDPVFQSQEEKVKNQSYISYDYMCCSDAEIFRTHTLDLDVPLPECKRMDCNYYVVNGMYYTSYDSQEVLEEMNRVIASGENPVVFKYSDDVLYQEARRDIFGSLIQNAAQNLSNQYGVSEVKYSYIDDDRFHKIVIYWQYP